MNNWEYYLTVLAVIVCWNMTVKAQSYNRDIPVIEEFSIDPMTINQTIDKPYKPLEFCIGKQHISYLSSLTTIMDSSLYLQPIINMMEGRLA